MPGASGQIVDATLVAAPRQRNTDTEKAAIKAADEIWPEKPAKARQKDTDARWTVKFSKAKPAADGKPQINIAMPAFDYKSHICIDRRHGVIRRARITDAAAHDGARLREGLIDPANTASDVWADSAYRSAQNEKFLARIGKVSRIHRRKPEGKPMPKRTARANAANSAVRARVEHPFAHLCASEGADGDGDPDHRPGARDRRSDAYQHRVHHEAMVLARRKSCVRGSPRAARPRSGSRKRIQTDPTAARSSPAQRPASLKTTVPGGAQMIG